MDNWMNNRNEHHEQDRGASRKQQRLQALSTAEVARRAAVYSGTRLIAGLPSQRDPQQRPRVLPFVPKQRETPTES